MPGDFSLPSANLAPGDDRFLSSGHLDATGNRIRQPKRAAGDGPASNARAAHVATHQTKTKQKKRRKRGAVSCFCNFNQRQNRCTIPTPTPTMLRDDEGVELKPSPIVAVALMMLRPFVPSVWPFAR